MAFREIEDVRRIKQLSKKLNQAVTRQVRKTEYRRIGFPGGHEDRDVHFLESGGDDSLWYISWRVANYDKHVTLFGHGKIGTNDWLSIDVQFNFPVETFHRRMGAAFLEDTETGQEFLAHKGIVTLRQRVPKDKVLEAMSADVIEVETSKGVDEYLLAADLDSETVVEDIGNFAMRLRTTIRNMHLEASDPIQDVDTDEEVIEQSVEEQTGSTNTGGSPATLEDYFEEFSGHRRTFTPKKSFPISYHGKIVHALHEEMAKRGKTLKSRAVDLVADLENDAILFEVKTKANTQSIYCAIGQLTVHQPTVEKFLKKPVRKVLVLPAYPMDLLSTTIKEQLGISIVTFTMSASGKVGVSGLANI